MLKYIRKALALSAITNRKIKTNDYNQLESLKDRLMDRFGSPVGWHTVGIPMVFSMLCALISCAMQQAPLWLAIFNWLGFSEKHIFIGILPSLAIFCIAIIVSMLAAFRGYESGLKLFLFIIFLTFAASVIVLLATLVSVDGNYRAKLIGAIIGFLSIVLSLSCLNTRMFVRSICYALHNRVWRKQLKIQTRSI
jgi:hypothetical protein